MMVEKKYVLSVARKTQGQQKNVVTVESGSKEIIF